MSTWDLYYKKLSNKPPRPLLIKALTFADVSYKSALDIGAGTLNDTQYLLEDGWSVTAVDSSKEFIEYATTNHPKLKIINLPIEEYEFDKKFTLINAQFVLPFIDKGTFNQTIKKIFDALDTDGIFCGQFFGIHDEWNNKHSKMTFLTKEDLDLILTPLKIININEIEEDKETAAGQMKHWHVYHVIGRKL